MSYDISLCCPVTDEVLVLDTPHHMRGGMYAMGGETTASLNVTYNYHPHFRRVLGEDGIRTLYGKSGAETLPLLEGGIAALKDDVSEDYWEATEGNAKKALYQLLSLAQMHPDGVWYGD